MSGGRKSALGTEDSALALEPENLGLVARVEAIEAWFEQHNLEI